MKCLRCDAIMVYDKCYGYQDTFWGWKRVACGEIVDPVILENRRSRRR